MGATEELQKCLGNALDSMHALRSRVLLRAVEAVIHGRRLTLVDLARSWPGAERVRAPLKALDRLLGNCHLHAEREHIYRELTRWLVRNEHAIIIDWSDLNQDRSWHLLRAAIPVGGRSLTILDLAFLGGHQGSTKAEKVLLQRMAHVLPDYGAMEVARSKPLTSRVVVHAKPPKGCKHRKRQGIPARNSNSR